ncbi:MAG: MFS transporter [Chloroflexi bacterium]|nr:MFS transporter [Chloroflexota bacterium]MYF64533.1 MFS transporter [Chloroflexota bacterium]MYK36065.1 MFS transporter [Chloroflexota bacterium]
MTALLPAWITRDAALIIAARALHTFSQGLLAVMLGVYLVEQIGIAVLLVGLFFGLGFASTAAFSFLSTFVSERVGRRKLMVVYSLITLAGSVGLAATSNPAALVVFAFVGSFNGAAGNVGPTQSLEQASIAGVVAPARRTELFALYRVVASTAGALGALAAGLPVALESFAGVSEPASFRIVLWGLVGLRLVIALLFTLLSEQVEAERERREWINPVRLPSSGRIFTLTGLFSLDQLAGAIIVRGLLALWFNERFGLDLASLGVLFFIAQIVGVASLWVAGKLANRIGLINTMSLAHLPSGLLLLAVAFSPWAWLAVTFLLVRALFDQIDVPARDSYIMSVVQPHERVAMGSIHIVGRSISGTIGPTLSTGVLAAIALSAPLVGSALVKVTYTLSLYFMFRNVKAPQEMRAAERREG